MNNTFVNGVSFGTQAVFTNSIQIPLSPVDGYVLTSDSSGNATWAIPGALALTTLNPVYIGTDSALGGTEIALGRSSGGGQITDDFSIAIGYLAAQVSQGAGSIAIGNGAGQNTLPSNSVAIGVNCLQSGAEGVAIGVNALIQAPSGATGLVAMGDQAGYYHTDVSTTCTYIGSGSGPSNGATGISGSTALGYNATITGANQIVLGTSSERVFVPGNLNLTLNGVLTGATLICDSAGNATWVSPGTLSLSTLNPINIGTDPTLGGQNVAIGQGSGTSQAGDSIAIGYQAGGTSQGGSDIAIGTNAGTTQIGGSIAIGESAGASPVGTQCIAIGDQAGQTGQDSGSIAIGIQAGLTSQAANAIAIGSDAGFDTQGVSAIAIGNNAGYATQGAGAIAIGAASTFGSQFAGSVVINATGSGLGTSAAGFFAAPIRVLSATSGALPLPMVYDTIAKELVASDLPIPVYGVANNLAISFDIIGSGGGTIVWVQPEQGSAYKKVAIYCNALIGTASFTFANPFVNIPAIITDSTAGGIPATAITALSTTDCTITGTTTTGFIFLEGF
jgi:hypothetical protein